MTSSPLPPRSPKEKNLIKLALAGGSIIDTSRLYFSDESEVLHFLRINEYDLSRQRDNDRLLGVHNEAVSYLNRELSCDISPALAQPKKMTDLFLKASDFSEPALQKEACSLLKAMNIINHIDGRELLYNCPISLRDLFSLVEDKIERTLSALSRNTTLLVKYQGGRKAKESLITKLLSKRDTIAAQINDRVRYRIVTRKQEDVINVILHLFDTILPFNYIIPGSSVNQLITIGRKLKLANIVKPFRRLIPNPSDLAEYTAKDYRVCKFVVDIPIRMDNFLAKSGGSVYRESLGTIVYVLVEFQIIDEETDRSNGMGDSSHENYKKRQKKGVIRRITQPSWKAS